MGSEVYVLDATPMIIGYSPALSATPHFTTQSVFEEVGEEVHLRLTVSKNWLRIREPSKESLRAAQAAANKTRDDFVLSPPDLSILALSLDLLSEGYEVTLITDDYAVQNVATQLHIPTQNYAWKGIRRIINWQLYCPTCRKTYNTQVRTCPNCGSTLKRRIKRAKMSETHVNP